MMKAMFPLCMSLVLASGVLCADAPGAVQDYPSYNPGDLLPKGQFPDAFNPRAGIEIKRADGKWRPDLVVDLSFLYYFATEEGLDYAESASLQTDFAVFATNNSRVLKQDFDYKPGFKVGIGTNIWEWDILGEYTWIRQNNHTHKEAPNPSPNNGTGVWYMDSWFILPNSATQQSLAASEVNAHWHLAMDLADLTISHPYYIARALTVAPSFGIRGAWIRQKVNINAELPPQGITNQLAEVSSLNSSNSWSVGPRAGVCANFLLGMGFRLQGDLYGSLLFTQYTHVKHSEQTSTSTPIGGTNTISVKLNDFNCVRPVAEMGLGLGWGSYFCKDKFHFDFSANYDFSVYWNQNMMRKLVDEMALGGDASPSNLSLNGLNLTARFDF